MAVETSYISVGCNPVPHALDWGRNGLVCFGAATGIAIYDPDHSNEAGKILHILPAHTARINSVRWMSTHDNQPESYLVSASVDKTASCWSLEDGKFKKVARLEGHTEEVTVSDGVHLGSSILVATAASDSTVRIWSQFESVQVIQVAPELVLDVKLHMISGTVLMACAASDCKVHLFVDNTGFKRVATLTGHEDWVRGVDFAMENGDILLATCAQDALIRLWRLTTQSQTGGDLKLPEITFEAGGDTWIVKLESVLSGHESRVYAARWLHTPKLQLLSVSWDKSAILWEPEESGVWTEVTRIGQVGGSSGGFLGGAWNQSGAVLLHGFQGSLHLWRQEENDWTVAVAPSGHFGPVSDIDWNPMGAFLISVSEDQTTRLHGCWKKAGTWHELSRVQIHGHDLTCVAGISNWKFASGGEEKVGRAFEAPRNAIENLCRFTGADSEKELVGFSGPEGATIPSLGLSNKAIYEGGQGDAEFTPVHFKQPPPEDHLLRNTLWPEVHKLYGHGYELICMAANPTGTLLATACRSTDQANAEIILWNVSTWEIHARLRHHKLTVTQLAFSPCNAHLLSVSRDRTWALFSTNESGDWKTRLVSGQKSLHTRIIWTCAWTLDSQFFATGSRDGKVGVWNADTGTLAGTAMDLKTSVTALDFGLSTGDKYLVAVGMENGVIGLYMWSKECWSQVFIMDNHLRHLSTVKCLKFRPCEEKDVALLASCSTDHSVRLHTIKL